MSPPWAASFSARAATTKLTAFARKSCGFAQIAASARVGTPASAPPMTIRPKGWPIGEARVQLTVEEHRRGCKVTIVENAIAGPGSYVPDLLMQPAIWVRNRETLRRLGWVAAGRAGRD